MTDKRYHPLDLVQLLDNSCAGSIMVDRDCRITWLSANYRQLLELPDDLDPRGQQVEALIPHSLMRQVVTSGQPQLLDLMRFKERWFVVTRLPLIDAAGELQGALGMVFFDELAYLRPVVDKFTRLHATPAGDSDRAVRYGFDDLLGNSEPMLTLRQQALRAAATDSTLLLLGETGTGKEILAQAVHAASHRANGPFVGVNTAALPEALVEAELFGAAPGAYTGADRKGRRGKFELAQGGTLFLDEIGEMTAPVQSKLLRALQERKVEPLGASHEIEIDVRVVAATSRDLEQQVADGRFRADLYYRLNVLPLTLPPLRERGEDITLLAQNFNRELAEQLGVAPLTLDPRLLRALSNYRWPGNIRELRNVMERALLFAEQGRVPTSLLTTFLPGSITPDSEPAAPVSDTQPPAPLAEQLAATERQALLHALAHTGGNRRAAAALLGISRAAFYDKLNKHQLQ
ncbi:sigma-54 interaction domain-containing protein [Motiliproteus sediminis]|uniref:sigma-54 interaction domain-containing protein n=1 Tax=Motiliproteus sediminis TaxID=1468178 RepID=UPI001FE7F12C|nr:sigma 54-interacting transcriptional regulator [Motiliproteus sediminis]